MRWVSIGVAVALAATAERADAQRYRVLVADENGERNVIEFRPCIPAEGSGCGAWIDHEATPDTSARLAPRLGAGFGPSDSVWIAQGAVRIRGAKGEPTTIRDRRGAATTLALAPTRDYAFVVLRAVGGATSTVVMVDLSTRSVIASCPLPSVASALSVIR